MGSSRVSSSAELGQLIRARRKEVGLVLVDAAGLMGVSVRFLSEVERGKPRASLSKVLHVLERLGLDVWVTPRGARTR